MTNYVYVHVPVDCMTNLSIKGKRLFFEKQNLGKENAV